MYAISKLRPAVLVRRLPGTLRHLSSVEPVVVLSPDAQRIADIQHPKKNVREDTFTVTRVELL